LVARLRVSVQAPAAQTEDRGERGYTQKSVEEDHQGGHLDLPFVAVYDMTARVAAFFPRRPVFSRSTASKSSV
jgi:hypothetical protein